MGKKLITAKIRPVPIYIYPDGRMNIANTARFIGVSQETLAMWRVQGVGPLYIKRGRVYYYREDVEKWLKSGYWHKDQQKDLKKSKKK